MTEEELKDQYRGQLVLREIFLRSLTMKPQVIIISRLLTLGMTLLPYICAIIIHKRLLLGVEEYAITGLFCLFGQLVIVPNLAFIMVGIFDLKRKLFFMKACTKLLNPNSATCGEFLASNIIPTIDIMNPDNYYSWLKARRILMNAGLKFTSRIFLYLGVYLGGVLFILTFVILK